ncbi:MAG: restriction endonuclease subunit S [Magnetococcales bacterium]|nr:restriction endonuclease subunit S [Magnetococcales bacterium]
MRANWKTVPISELYEGLYDGPHATPKPSDAGPVFLGIKNVTDDGHLDMSDIRHIAEEDFPTWTRRVEPKPGDIVFTYEATLNRYAIIPQGFRGCLGRRMALIRTNPKKVETLFLFYYFFSPSWREVIKGNMMTGSTVDRIPLITFPGFPVTLPPLPIQRRIAGILSAYDDLIENNQRRIKILETMARTLYREWFVHFRFPDHENVRRVPSPLGEIPEGWEIKNLPECVHVNPRVVVPRDGEKSFVPMGCLSNDSMLITDIESRTGNSGAKFQNRDTLFARITPCLENGKTGFVQFLPDKESVAFGSTEFIVLRSRTLSPEFVYCLARSDEFRGVAIKSMSGATGRQRVQERCFDDFQITQPPYALIDRFSDVVAPSFRLIYKLHLQIQNLRRTRDLLLPRLLSGQIDVEAFSSHA